MKRAYIDLSLKDEQGSILPSCQTEVNLTEEEEESRKAEIVTDEERAISALRELRNQKLAETDWTQGADVPDAIKNAYTNYRQKLRDITKTYNNPRKVVWPDKP